LVTRGLSADLSAEARDGRWRKPGGFWRDPVYRPRANRVNRRRAPPGQYAGSVEERAQKAIVYTTLQARGLKPDDVRHLSDDLWLFPYYVDTSFVPFDARPGGPASGMQN